MTSVSAGHIILTLTQPVGSGRLQRESNPAPPHQESSALPTELTRPGERERERERERGGGGREGGSEREREREGGGGGQSKHFGPKSMVLKSMLQ